MTDSTNCGKCSREIDDCDLILRWGWYYCPNGHRVKPGYKSRQPAR